MSNRRIDDHSFWAGKPSKGSVYPDGPHKVKMESSSDSSGHLPKYEDTTEEIRKQQMESVHKAKGHNMKPGYRY
jgi:flagellar hook assembly protein FlgD